MTLTAKEDTGQTASLPPTLSGRVYLRVRNIKRGPQDMALSLNTLCVDHLFGVEGRRRRRRLGLHRYWQTYGSLLVGSGPEVREGRSRAELVEVLEATRRARRGR